ncbi:MAG: hypothetical protein J1E64_14640 [Acetatifactor sp.]|nr:hypothetical protein [Acetatifactor sp.]
MRKKIISIILVGIMVHFLFACGRTESTETSNTGLELMQDEASENVTIQDETSREMPDWLAAYVDYLEGMEDFESYYKCSFLYVDGDDIPEFVIDTSTYETACTILTFHNGEVGVLQTGGLRVRYIEKKNLLCETSGQAGEYADQVYSIENGKWIYVAGGKYISEFKDGLYVDKFSFEWEGEKVEEELYWERLHHVFDEEQAIVPKQYIWCNNMLSQIEAGDFAWVWTAEQDTEEETGEVIADFEYSDEYIPISKVDFASYQNEMSGENWQALSSFFPVLLEGKTFMAEHCPYPGGYTDDFAEYSINNLYASWFPEYPAEFILDRFVLCDLTGDGQKELIVYSDFSIGLYCIFHKEGDDFYAVYMPVRWFEDLQTNGIYVGSGGAATSYFRCLHFLRDVFWEEELAMYDWDYNEIGGEEVSEAEMGAWIDEMMVGEAIWYDARAVKL